MERVAVARPESLDERGRQSRKKRWDEDCFCAWFQECLVRCAGWREHYAREGAMPAFRNVSRMTLAHQMDGVSGGVVNLPYSGCEVAQLLYAAPCQFRSAQRPLRTALTGVQLTNLEACLDSRLFHLYSQATRDLCLPARPCQSVLASASASARRTTHILRKDRRSRTEDCPERVEQDFAHWRHRDRRGGRKRNPRELDP